MFGDMVLYNGKVVTVDANESIAEAVATKFGRILAVGSKEKIKPLIGSETEVIDLKRRTVIPGMLESHCHISRAGEMQRAETIDASYEAGVRSLADILAKIAEQAKKKPKGEWINVAKEDESKLVEKRHPNRWDLDTVSPDHPVSVSTVGGHFSIVNSKAFKMAGVTKDTPDPPGGRFEREPATGELTGWVYERAGQLLRKADKRRSQTLEETMEGIKWIGEQYVASGLTYAYDGAVRQGVTIKAYQGLLSSGELPLRIRLEIWYELMPHLASLGIIQGFGHDMLKVGGLKIVADGAVSARTAAVAEPYLHRAEYYGELAITKEELHRIIMEGYPKGYRFCVHANGEKAINMFLDTIEEAQGEYPRKDPRNRIIHCTVVTPEIIARIKKLGVLPTIFGPYPYYHGDKLLPAFGAERLERMFTAKSFLDMGIKVAAHSDHSASPYPPLMGIHSLVNRRTATGQPIGMSQKISVMEALKLYTINAAYHTFEEDVLGSIEVGKFADMVVLGKDILTVPTETIMDIPVDITIVGGKIVYQKES